MRLAHARRTQQQNDFAIGDEEARREFPDLAFVDRGLGGKIEAGQVPHERKARQADAHLDAPLVLAGDLPFAEQGQRLADGQLAPAGLIDEAVELVADGGQLEAAQHANQAIVSGAHQKPPPIRASYSASGRNSAGAGSSSAAVDRLAVRMILARKPATPSK